MSDKELAYSNRVDDYPIKNFVPTLTSREVLNDNSKTITVADDQIYHMLWIRYEYTADGTSGTRTPTISVRDGNNDVIWEIAGPTLTASQTSIQQLSAGTAGDLELPDPLYLDEGWDMIIVDTTDVAAAGDDLIVHFIYIIHDKVT